MVECVQILIDVILKKTVKRGQKIELTGRSPLRRRRSAADCSAVYEQEEGYCDR